MTFEEFKKIILEDFGNTQEEDWYFKNRDADPVSCASGYEAQGLKFSFFAYAWEDGEWLYIGGRGSQGRGPTLAQAKADEDKNYLY